MQLTKRFFMLNALAVLVSIAVTALAAMLFLAVYTKLAGGGPSSRDLERIMAVRSGIGELRSQAAVLSFEQLLDRQVQQDLSERTELLGGHVVIYLNREVVFTSASLTALDLEKSLILTDNVPGVDTLELDGRPYIFARTDYRLPSGDKGVLLLLAPVHFQTNFYLVTGAVAAGVFLVTFLLMNAWVSYKISRSIILPVSRLRDAAVKISEGDLSAGIAEEGDGEVRELARTLELMRIKLKESVYWQQKSDDNRRFLISSISHDLKTPVTAIKGYIEGILDGVARTPEKMVEYLETARAKADLVNLMIDDLLLYAKLDMGQIPYHFERTDILRYFEDCVADDQHEFEKAGIRLTLVNELKEPALVRIDRERFRRVVQNVLDNARKYMRKPEGRVDVVLRETRTSVIVEIRDNGQGIPEDQLPYIFDRFYRADSSRKSAEGSGLGLAIAKQIVEDHEGKIWMTSTEGQGTRVMISLSKL
jgi:signal transduction histidine kinase